jgi:mono/diheme cytochrome c family protein
VIACERDARSRTSTRSASRVQALGMTKTFVCMAVLAGMLGCTNAGESTTESTNEQLAGANQSWLHDALPVLAQACAACHGGTDAEQVSPSLGFLLGTQPFDVRDTLLSSGMVDLDAPYNSGLLTKGVHEGPRLSTADVEAIVRWIDAERDTP